MKKFNAFLVSEAQIYDHAATSVEYSLSEVLISEWLNTASPPERFLQQPLIGPNKLLPLLLEHVRAELLVKGPFVSSLPRVFRIAFALKGYYSQIYNLEELLFGKFTI